MKTITVSITLVLTLLTCVIMQAQTITLTATNGQPSSYNFTTNQVITVNSFISNSGNPNLDNFAYLSFHNGLKTRIAPYGYGLNQIWGSTGNGLLSTAFSSGGAVFTGVTNVQVATTESDVLALTFTVTTPTPQSMIPANAVVIPSDATGPVQIALESSSDLVNWTAALPGTYGNTHSNRFFRVRAIAQ